MTLILRKINNNPIIGKPFAFLTHTLIRPFISDAFLIKDRYEKKMGEKLDLKNPLTLNQKICWLKLYDRTELHTICADKYAVRDYVSEAIGEEFLVPLLFKTTNANDIIPQNMPLPPFIIKPNHDSGGGYIVKDMESVNWSKIRYNLKKRLKRNYYNHGREWQYKNISRKIIVERLLIDKNGNPPFDYKIHMFNGKAQMIQVDIGRGTANHCRNWYSSDWEREPYKWSSPKKNGKRTDPSDKDVPRPKNLEKMIQLSEKLAEPFDYVRIDWYDVDDEIYFGEITFHHDGGSQPILPREWDVKLGEMLVLSKTQT